MIHKRTGTLVWEWSRRSAIDAVMLFPKENPSEQRSFIAVAIAIFGKRTPEELYQEAANSPLLKCLKFTKIVFPARPDFKVDDKQKSDRATLGMQGVWERLVHMANPEALVLWACGSHV